MVCLRRSGGPVRLIRRRVSRSGPRRWCSQPNVLTAAWRELAHRGARSGSVDWVEPGPRGIGTGGARSPQPAAAATVADPDGEGNREAQGADAEHHQPDDDQQEPEDGCGGALGAVGEGGAFS